MPDVGQTEAEESHEVRDLFGGAIKIDLPTRFSDISDVRPVPDHQEVFADGDEDQSCLIEIVELADGVSDDAAPAYFFEDLASVNGALLSVIESATPLSPEDVPGAPAGTCMWLVVGRQAISKGRTVPGNPVAPNEVQVILAVLRLRDVASELLLSLNSPITIHPDSASAPHAGAGLKQAYLAAPALMRRALRSLRVLDCNLFGHDDAA